MLIKPFLLQPYREILGFIFPNAQSAKSAKYLLKVLPRNLIPAKFYHIKVRNLQNYWCKFYIFRQLSKIGGFSVSLYHYCSEKFIAEAQSIMFFYWKKNITAKNLDGVTINK